MNRTAQVVPLLVLWLALSHPAQAQGPATGKRHPIDPQGIARLVADSGGSAQVTVNDATGAARFVRTSPGGKLGLLKQAARAVSEEAKLSRSAEFLTTYGSIFGITDVSSELETVRVAKDPQRGTHIVQRQLYQGVPVFCGELRSHFDASDELVAVTGTFVPEIAGLKSGVLLSVNWVILQPWAAKAVLHRAMLTNAKTGIHALSPVRLPVCLSICSPLRLGNPRLLLCLLRR